MLEEAKKRGIGNEEVEVEVKGLDGDGKKGGGVY